MPADVHHWLRIVATIAYAGTVFWVVRMVATEWFYPRLRKVALYGLGFGGTMLLVVFNRAFSDAVLVWLFFGLIAAFFAVLTAPEDTPQ